LTSKQKSRTVQPVRPNHRRPQSWAKWSGWHSKLLSAGAFTVLALVGWAASARHFAPASNTSRTRFDAIIVLGNPADRDGNPTPRQLARVTEGVHEYERGVAPRLILTGGAAANQFVEAEVMARTAEAQGVPASAIFIEPQAQDTIQNACYSVRIMKAHGWGSAEVVSSAYHLPRAGILFNRLPVEWSTHAAPPLTPTANLAGLAPVETLKTLYFLIWTRWTERCVP
jgi:uncharacterized SAM-binding protein YcdF (DUF218 family)